MSAVAQTGIKCDATKMRCDNATRNASDGENATQRKMQWQNVAVQSFWRLSD